MFDIPTKSYKGDEYFSSDHLKVDLKKRALKGAGSLISAQIVIYCISMIGVIILARLLSPDDFGVVAMVTAFSLLLSNFGINGFTEAVIQKDNINHEEISMLFWTNLIISLALSFIFIALAPLIVGFYNDPRLRKITIAMALAIFMGGISTQHLSLLKRNMKFFSTSLNEVFAVAFGVVVAIILAWQGWGYWALVSRSIAIPISTAIGGWILCSWRPGFPTHGTNVKPMLKFALNSYGNFMMNYFRRNLDKILIGRIYGSQPLGFYDRAYHLSSMLPNLVTVPLSSVAVASLSRLRDDPIKYRHYFSMVFSTLAFICMPLSMVLTLIGNDLILLLLGPQWGKAGAIFSAFGPGIGMLVLYSTHGWLHVSLGRADRWFVWGIIALIVTVIAYAIGLPFGPLGVAIAYSASFYILIFPALWYAGRPINLEISLFISAIWRFWTSAFVAYILSWLILYFFNLTSNIFIDLNIFVRLLVSCVIYMIIYLLLIFIFYQSMKPVTQFISVLQNMVPEFKR